MESLGRVTQPSFSFPSSLPSSSSSLSSLEDLTTPLMGDNYSRSRGVMLGEATGHLYEEVEAVGGYASRTAVGAAVWGMVGAAQLLGSQSAAHSSDPGNPGNPFVVIRANAAGHLEERQSEWAYSRPVVALDLLWNLACILVTIAFLVIARHETPPIPLRVWLAGYSLQCLAHIYYVLFEYRKRLRLRLRIRPPRRSPSATELDFERDNESNNGGGQRQRRVDITSVVKRLESANTTFSFIWWIVGFYWIVTGGDAASHDSPCLYRLCIVFLAFDVLFVVFCIALAFAIGIAICCCLPCIIAILYAITDQDGVSEEDIRALPKYKFRRCGSFEKGSSVGMSGEAFGGMMSRVGSPEDERFLAAEDAECCICISAYSDNAEIRELPCKHHFDCACIDKWLRMNATCPLCKYNLVENCHGGMEDD